MLPPVKIVAVSYLNTLPFLYGLRLHPACASSRIITLPPAECAQSFFRGEADIALVPVGALQRYTDLIIPGYCIGACGPVASVILGANVPLPEIRSILLDTESMTSVKLIQLLARDYWKITPDFKNNANRNFEASAQEAVLLIGDKALEHKSRFRYVYDLADEWIAFTKLPFVFACWVTKYPLEKEFITQFNEALSLGISHRLNAVSGFTKPFLSDKERDDYITNNISFELDDNKMKGLSLFMEMCDF